jgi:hypothetical protein
MNTFLGVVLFCMNGQCAFWKSDLLDNKLECEAVTLKVIDTMIKEKAQLVQGVCFPIKLGKPT